MNRTFEDRKPTKVYAKSKENQAIIKALNMYGRVPEQWELLEEIERLKIDNKRLQHNEKVFKSRNEKAIEDINKMMAGMFSKDGEHLWFSSCCNKRLEYIKDDLLNGGDEE